MALKRWAIGSFTANTPTTLLTAQTGGETVLFSLLLSSYAATDVDILVEHKAGITLLFKWELTKSAAESLTAIDSAIVLEPGDSIIITSTSASISALASGEVK